MDRQRSPAAPTSSRRRTGRAAFVPVTLLALTAVFLADPFRFHNPVAPQTVVPAWAVDVSTVRRPSLRPEITLEGYTYRCSECHNLFPSPPETDRPLTQHRNIVLKHGINTRCFNCHHLTNRDAFVDDYGREIPYDNPPILCAKCHGPVYRDWTHGSHGRTNGYWDTGKGTMERKRCIDCHDPHIPPFPPMKPAPPPNTLRMGDQSLGPAHAGEKNPLRIYRQAQPETTPGDSAPSAVRGHHDSEGVQ
jgi:hypothetical protein